MKGLLRTYSARTSGLFVLALPLFSFFFCVIYSLLANFKESTETHCKVANLLPSISAAIGNFAPQKYVWRAGIGLHIAPRYAYAWGYCLLHQNNLTARYSYLAYVAFILEIVEVSCLLGLSMVSSVENYPIHEKFFLTFLWTSIFYQLLCAFVLPRLLSRRGTHHRRSLDVKRKCCYVTLICTVICGITFYRHNSHCEPYMYTGFALAEYLIVLCNIVFHGTAFYDFHGATYIFTSEEDDAVHLLKRASF